MPRNEKPTKDRDDERSEKLGAARDEHEAERRAGEGEQARHPESSAPERSRERGLDGDVYGR